MKKTLSLCLAVVFALTFAFSASAAGTPSRDRALNEINATIGYVSEGISAYTADSAVNYYYMAKEGTKGADYYSAFLQSVKENLSANSGKLVTAYGENISSYAAVTGIIDAMGGDPADIESVNLAELLENSDISSVSSPYHYNIIIPAAEKYCSKEFVKSVCDSFIDDYYVMGSGMNYWGFGCDNTAMFLSAIAQSGLDCYDAVIEDAVNVLNTYKTEGGYCYNTEYGTSPNVNSTGLALMAKCAYYEYKGAVKENLSELTDLYNELLTFKGQTEGSFAYDGTESPYSAADALKGLMAFYEILPVENHDAPDDKDAPDVKPEKPDSPDAVKPNTEKNDGIAEKNPDIPNTDASFSVLSVAVMSLSVVFASASVKKRQK